MPPGHIVRELSRSGRGPMWNLLLPWQASTSGSPKPWSIGSFSDSWSEYSIRVFHEHDLGACIEVRKGPYGDWVPPLVTRSNPVSSLDQCLSGESGQSFSNLIHGRLQGCPRNLPTGKQFHASSPFLPHRDSSATGGSVAPDNILLNDGAYGVCCGEHWKGMPLANPAGPATPTGDRS